MDPRAVIATRIDLLLRRQLGEAVDTARVLRDARYARDILLVCDALAGTEAPRLARQFRAAGKHMHQAALVEHSRAGHAEGPPQGWAAQTSGFGLPGFGTVASADGNSRTAWYSPRRWIGAR